MTKFKKRQVATKTEKTLTKENRLQCVVRQQINVVKTSCTNSL